ncbi:MAG: hypothetical protein QNJ55_26335 [Xenococcus sp. MO_188.B8]|nr:hypothetical protein [Xenococcus sp. MO_188.B8]
MSNINEITDSEKLFVELNPEEGACVSGGAVTLVNASTVAFSFRTFNEFLTRTWRFMPAGPVTMNPAASITIPGAGRKYALYDEKIGPGIEPRFKEIFDDVDYTFLENNGKLELKVLGSAREL